MFNADIKNQLKKLPTTPGVYIFSDAKKDIIYVGKATSLKSRVSSYFLNKNQGEYARPIERMIAQVEKIKTIETETVLEALILEANLIKKYQPKYNVDGKDDKSFAYFVITKEDFPRVLIMRETDLSSNQNLPAGRQGSKLKIQNYQTYGPYTSKVQMQIALKIIRKIFPFHSRKEKSEKGCLEFQIGLCSGPYEEAISKADYKKNIKGIKMILEGKKKGLLKFLEKEMLRYSKEEKYEKALETKNKIFALKHIQEIALLGVEIKTDIKKDFRIEAYDISNISGEFAVGSMVVFNGGNSDKSQYRKFKIKTITGADDVGMMREMLIRRLSNKWPLPNLIILDGGKGHLNMGLKILGENNLSIPIIGVAKGPERKNLKVEMLDFKISPEIKKVLSDKKLLKRITDEAHRFAITYHKKIRDRGFSNA